MQNKKKIWPRPKWQEAASWRQKNTKVTAVCTKITFHKSYPFTENAEARRLHEKKSFLYAQICHNHSYSDPSLLKSRHDLLLTHPSHSSLPWSWNPTDPRAFELLTQKISNPLRYQAHPSVSRSDSSRKRTKQLQIFKFLAIKALFSSNPSRFRQITSKTSFRLTIFQSQSPKPQRNEETQAPNSSERLKWLPSRREPVRAGIRNWRRCGFREEKRKP